MRSVRGGGRGTATRNVRPLMLLCRAPPTSRPNVPVAQVLAAPSVKDFVHIISFLLKATVPNFEFDNKFEDEVPAVLKLLGYPYNISRSSLQSVGAPHAWPPILAALSWLVDLLNYTEAANAAESDAADGFDTDGCSDAQGAARTRVTCAAPATAARPRPPSTASPPRARCASSTATATPSRCASEAAPTRRAARWAATRC